MKNVNPNRCAGQTKGGKPCRAAATAGGLCFFRANPNKASELGRIGGRKRRSGGTETSNEFPAVVNAVAVREINRRRLQALAPAAQTPLLGQHLPSSQNTVPDCPSLWHSADSFGGP
jgi:hypothetical protein